MSKGDALEQLVSFTFNSQAVAGLDLAKTSPEFRGAVDKNGKAHGYLVAAGRLDFVGDYWGQHVEFDCKVIDGAKVASLPMSDRYLKPHQLEIVERAHCRGAIAFFLLEIQDGWRSEYFALSWPFLAPWVADAKAGGRKSIPLEAVRFGALPVQMKGMGLDLLGAIVAVRGLREGVRHG